MDDRELIVGKSKGDFIKTTTVKERTKIKRNQYLVQDVEIEDLDLDNQDNHGP